MRKLLLFFVPLFAFSQLLLAQSGSHYISAEAGSISPIGTLGDRFKGTVSGSVSFGIQSSEKLTWFAKAEYFKFDDVNRDKMYMSKKVLVGSSYVFYRVPLSDLSMDLTVAGISANAKYNIIKTGFFEGNVEAGFGMYRWTGHRSGLDSVSVDTSSSKNVKKYYNLLKNGVFTNVPPSHQQDWSGGFNLGAELVFHISEPVSLTIAGNYKNIIGELWPTLELNIENVSTFQMLECRAGLRVKL
jgi:hypothetical protein